MRGNVHVRFGRRGRENPTAETLHGTSSPTRLLKKGIKSARGGEVGRWRGACLGRSFSGALLPNRTGPFPGIRLSSDYCVIAALPEWIWVWQSAQTMSVLRRRLTMIFVQVLLHDCLSRSRSASLRTW